MRPIRQASKTYLSFAFLTQSLKIIFGNLVTSKAADKPSFCFTKWPLFFYSLQREMREFGTAVRGMRSVFLFLLLGGKNA
jgi:hypothetical protein